jgi:hypothetical protein
MVRSGDKVVWRTELEGSECGEGSTIFQFPRNRFYRCRWHENFSPSVQVERVEIFALTPTGQRIPVAPTGALEVQAFDPILGATDTWRCAFEAGTGRAQIAGPETGCDDLLVTTPTYTLDAFAVATAEIQESGATPITVPLVWSANLATGEHPEGARIFIEFALIAKEGQALMVATPSEDLGEVRVGRTANGRLSIRNAGFEAARITHMSLIGTDAADFQFRVLRSSQPPLRLPLDVTFRGKGIEIKLRDSWAPFLPLVEHSRGAVDDRVSMRSRDSLNLVTPKARAEVGSALTGLPTSRSPLLSANSTNPLNTRSTPFTLAPGESAEIFVEMTPTGYGDRRAHLRFDGHELNRPDHSWSVLSALHGFALSGPSFIVSPDGPLAFPYPLRPRSPERVLFLDNFGDEEGLRTDVAIVGPDAARFRLASEHASVRHIPPGDVEMFRLALTSPCGPVRPGSAPILTNTWQATFRIDTSEGSISVPLSGRPLDCFERAER